MACAVTSQLFCAPGGFNQQKGGKSNENQASRSSGRTGSGTKQAREVRRHGREPQAKPLGVAGRGATIGENDDVIFRSCRAAASVRKRCASHLGFESRDGDSLA